MLLAPLLRCGCFQCYISPVLCASPHFEQVALAGGLFRTVSHTPFMKLGNSAQCLTLASLQVSHHMRLGALLYPRFRVLRQHSAIPYVALVVISCVLATCAYLE